MNNTLSKEVRKRSLLRNKYFRQRSNTNKLTYNKGTIACLFCKAKKDLFQQYQHRI